MLKYLILAILGTTVSAQCCDRRAPECQSRYGSCMTSTNANFQQCETVFCTTAPYPLPTSCCDQKLPDCQMKFQQCLTGTFGSFSLCSPTFCPVTDSTPVPPSPDFTKLPDQPTPAPTRVPEMPTRIPELPSPDFTRMPIPSIPELPSPVFTNVPTCCNRTSEMCSMAYDSCKRQGGMFCESMFCDGPPMPSRPPTDFTCCDRETDMCQKLHTSCLSSGGNMCDMMYCDRSPLPSRKPKPSPRFSAFPSPKFLRSIPSILPKQIESSLKVMVKERKEIENVTKIKEIQVKISCSLRMPLDNIKIKNITFIDSKGIRNVIKFNETEIDDADIPQIDCYASQPIARMLQTANVDIGYIVVDPTPELIAYDPVNLVSSVSNAQPTQSSSSSSATQQSSSNNLTTVLASVFGGALAVIGIIAMVSYIRHKNKPKPIQRQERVVRISVNPLEAVTSLPRVDSSRRQFGPQGSRV